MRHKVLCTFVSIALPAVSLPVAVATAQTVGAKRPYPVVRSVAQTNARSSQGAPVKGIASRAPVVVQVTQKPISAYDKLKQNLKAVRMESIEDVRSNTDVLSGRAIELKATVSGFLSTPQGRTLMLKTDEWTTTLSTTTQLNADPDSLRSLRPRAEVRVLAMVSAGSDGAQSMLSAIAATDVPEAQKLFKDEGEDTSDWNNDIIVVPPMTNAPLPLPQKPALQRPTPQRMTAPKKAAPAAATRILAPSQSVARLDREEQIESQIPVYQNLVRRHNKKLRDDQVEEIARAVLVAAYANNMDPRFLAAIIAVESDFDIYCLSSSGAMGLGQLMPFNLKEAGIRDPWNPTQNVHGTARLLRGHLDDYKSRADGTLLAVAAYNAGPGAVRRAGYKVPNGRQVQRYVWKVYYRYKEFAPDMFK
ncbi:MAG: hypothetical protein JWN98_2702 [Abditibacteriota bacterium]|nr:hypothetical protein [Abditibacteriota bacterium]